MFEAAELGHRVTSAQYAREVPKLREALLDAQYALKVDAHFPVIIVVAGLDGAGKGETINLLNAWLDARLVETHAFDEPTQEEGERPDMWRFWRKLPPKGSIGILHSAWYADPINDRVRGRTKVSDLERSI